MYLTDVLGILYSEREKVCNAKFNTRQKFLSNEVKARVDKIVNRN